MENHSIACSKFNVSIYFPLTLTDTYILQVTVTEADGLEYSLQYSIGLVRLQIILESYL